jgi:Dna[CI] antecedent, DciA
MAKAKKKSVQQETVATVLPWLSRNMGWEKQLDLHSIFVNWREIVDTELREHAQPQKIERGVLWLEVENSSWLQQFQYAKLELLEILNRSLKRNSIKDIKMILPKGDVFTKADKPGPVVSFVRPSAAKIAAFQRQVECIADEKCREALMQFWYLAEACKIKNK